MAKTTSAAKKRGRAAKPRNIGAEIIEGLTEALQFERGESTDSVFRAAPISARDASIAPAPTFTANEIVSIRKSLNVTQPIFAQALDVSAETVKAWEQGKYPPQGPARRLLQIAGKHPGILLENVLVKGAGDPRPSKDGSYGVANRGGAIRDRGMALARGKKVSRAAKRAK